MTKITRITYLNFSIGFIRKNITIYCPCVKEHILMSIKDHILISTNEINEHKTTYINELREEHILMSIKEHALMNIYKVYFVLVLRQ